MYKKWVSAHSANFCKWMVKRLSVDMVDYGIIIIIVIVIYRHHYLYNNKLDNDSSVCIHE